MTDRVENFFKWARENPIPSLLIIIFVVGMPLLSALNSAFGIAGHVKNMRGKTPSLDNANVVVLEKLKYGSVKELQRLTERLVENSNVTSYAWGDFLIEAQYYGWRAISNGLVYSGRVENMKSPIKNMPGDWEVQFLINEGEIDTKISFAGGNGYTLEELMGSPENVLYYDQWKAVRLIFINSIISNLVTNTKNENIIQPKRSLWSRIFRRK